MAHRITADSRKASVHWALYHHQRGRSFRPTRQELQTQKFTCPYCPGSQLVKKLLRKQEHGYVCPSCHWSIHRDDIWKPQQKEVPEVREPGDATRDEPVLDVSVEEAVIDADPEDLASMDDVIRKDIPVLVIA